MSHHDDPIIVYMSSASGSREKKKQQEAIFQFLDSMHIEYHAKDITLHPFLKAEMREKVRDPKALPPHVFKGSQYCGDFEAFCDAMERRTPLAFFKIDS